MGYKSKYSGAEVEARLKKMLNVTWAELVALRDEGQLIAGQMYRMTDYETMTSKSGSQSAGHPFDLVLTALDNKALDEKCSAIWSERDTDGYFTNSNLEAWDVRYCLDNDTKRFSWAAKAGGYLMVDEGGWVHTGVLNGTYEFEGTAYYKWEVYNAYGEGVTFYLLTTTESPNIGDEVMIYDPEYNDSWSGNVVALTQSTDGKGVIYRLIDEKRNDVPYDFKNIQFVRKITDDALDLENGTDTWCYTFSDFSSGVLLDESLGSAASNVFDRDCWDNVFIGHRCFSNTFGNGCSSNTFGNLYSYNTFGNLCSFNTFGNRCFSNTFGNECSSNTFGDEDSSNTFGSNCYSNTFGVNCFSNTFGNDCHSNTFGDDYSYNTFGNLCYSNTFGNGCSSNTFGNGCSSTFGNYCSSNTFGDDCSSNTFGNYCDYNTFGNDCSYNTFINTETASWNNKIQYYHISVISEAEIQVYRNRKYDTYITKDKSGNMVEYTVDDIINA